MNWIDGVESLPRPSPLVPVSLSVLKANEVSNGDKVSILIGRVTAALTLPLASAACALIVSPPCPMALKSLACKA